ncbi:MAG: metallophosphoesterase family protein [Desulfobacterales bacterium]|nr:metallophosphoesterase family protein [Desulfobacterales bacterium]
MIILSLSDIHGNISKIKNIKKEIESADIVLLSGDITNFGREKEIKEIISQIKSINSQILAVSGNCDFPEVDEFLNKEGINLHGKAKIINNVVFIGLGGSLKTPFGTPNEVTEESFQKVLKDASKELPCEYPIILLSHNPPINTLCDKLSTGVSVGSVAVRNFIEKFNPLICFTGHIHEADSIDTIGKTTIINPGNFIKGQYAYASISANIKEVLIKNII